MNGEHEASNVDTEVNQEERNKMVEIIARLSEQKEVRRQEYFDLGIEEGFEWGKTADYDDLLVWGESNSNFRRIQPGLPEEIEDDLKERRAELPGFDYAAYAEGWNIGAQRFWEQVEGEL